MAATNERSNETNRYTDKGATASVSLSLLYVAVLMPEGGRERRISCTHPSPNYMHATSVARLSSLEHGADAAKGTHTPPRRNIFSSSPPRPSRLSRSLPIHGCPESGLTRVRPSEGSRGSGPDQAGFVRSFVLWHSGQSISPSNASVLVRGACCVDRAAAVAAQSSSLRDSVLIEFLAASAAEKRRTS